MPSRWSLLLQLALAALAAYGVAALLRAPIRLLAWLARTVHGAGVPRTHFARITQPIAGMLALAAIALVLADIRGTPVQGTTSIVGEPAPAVYTALADLPPGAMLEWPLEMHPRPSNISMSTIPWSTNTQLSTRRAASYPSGIVACTTCSAPARTTRRPTYCAT
ncbi:MAG: hypothetical protein MI924_27700 [Chloroflexales bacterium]|nr:hypothetical protein [Chloroflexales bacterium]